MRRVEHLQCPAYEPVMEGTGGWDGNVGLIGGIHSRPDLDYVRTLVGTMVTEMDEKRWSPDGHCEIPMVQLYVSCCSSLLYLCLLSDVSQSYDFVLSAHGTSVPEDLSPSSQKLFEVQDGFVLQNVTGIRTHIVSRLDGKGYDIVRCKSSHSTCIVICELLTWFSSGPPRRIERTDSLRE